MALAVGILFFVALLLLLGKYSRRMTAVNAGLALGLLAHAGWWEPHLVGPVAVGLMGISVGILLFPFWVQPPLALFRGLLQSVTRYPHTLNGYLQLEVQELHQAQIEQFVRSWFADTEDLKERKRQVDGLLQGLGRSPRMRLLAGNPLLLSLMTLLYERNWRLPERRVELYEECVRLLTAKWDRLRGVTRKSRFPPEHKQRVLTQVAAQFHAAGVRVFEREQLLASLAAVLPAGSGDNCDPQAFLEEVMAHTGLLREKSRSSYDFVHLTFQEYFTACAFQEGGDGEALAEIAGWGAPTFLTGAVAQDKSDPALALAALLALARAADQAVLEPLFSFPWAQSSMFLMTFEK